MRVITKDIELTLHLCAELEELEERMREYYNDDNPGMILAQIKPNPHPDQKRIRCMCFSGRVSDDIKKCFESAAARMGHYDEETDE